MKLINLPNIITCCNVICGCIAVFFGLQGDMDFACLCIILGAVFDFFDGMTARALHISSPVGKELDSLADMVSFGLAPTVLAYQIGNTFCGSSALLFFCCAFMAAFSALRLAKFNCDERQSLSFIGLPTPANAIFWIGLSYVVRLLTDSSFAQSNATACIALLMILLLAMSILLISELPMFSLKLKPGHNGFAENKTRYIFLALVAIILICSGFLGLEYLFASAAPIILIYIILSIIDVLFLSKK